MAHVRTRYAWDDDDTVRISVSVGPTRDHLRHVGDLLCHPTEFNAIDRLLTVGARWDDGANTYDMKRPATPEDDVEDVAYEPALGRNGGRPRLVGSRR